jgi:urease accessory protein
MIMATIAVRASTESNWIPGEASPLIRLLRLASTTLPVGAYSYSQGLEWATASGAVMDAATAQRWISDALRYCFARLEAPLWWRLYKCWESGDALEVARWNDMFLCSRETGELRRETVQMGRSLREMLVNLAEPGAGSLEALVAIEEPAYVTVTAFAAARWCIPADAALTACCWSWCENQVLAALKTVPLGQMAGQRLYSALEPVIADAVGEAMQCSDDMLTNYAPGFALASTLHESQYSRLFRS